MKRKLAGAAITLLVAGLAGGCAGGGDDDKAATTGATAPPTKSRFIASADTICAATATMIDAAAAKLRRAAVKTGTLRVREVTTFLRDTSLPAYDAMLDELRALTPPAGDEQAIGGYVAALASAIDTAKGDPARYARNDAPDPFDAANARAQRYGMKACGS